MRDGGDVERPTSQRYRPLPGDGLVIGADGVKLNLDGHRVIGTLMPSPGLPRNASNASGITFRKTSGSVVTNGEVLQFAIGVQIKDGSANRVTRMNIHDNIGLSDGDGIAVFGMMPVQDAAREDESVARIPI